MRRPRDKRQDRLEQLHAYFRQLAGALLLGHWSISLHEGTQDDETILDVCVSEVMANASIGVSDLFWRMSREDQRETCVHELVHVHLERMEHALIDSIKAHLTAPSYQVALDAHRRANEQATDALARSVAFAFPLPPVFAQ